MTNPGIHKTRPVSGALAPWRIVAHAAAPGMVRQAAAAADALIGTADELGKQDNGRADVAMTGLPEVECGGAIAAGAPLTSDAQGRAVAAATAGQRIIGFALEAGETGVIITYQHAPGYKA